MKRFKITYVYKHDTTQIHPATIEGADKGSAVRRFVELNKEYEVAVVTVREVFKSIYTFHYAVPPTPNSFIAEPSLYDLAAAMEIERVTFHAEGYDREEAWKGANNQYTLWLWEHGYTR